MNNNFFKLSEGCNISWDPELLSNNFSSNQLDNNEPYWSHIEYANLFYCWNFYKNFKNECLEVFDHLKQIQTNLALSVNVDNRLLELFLNHKLDPNNGLGLVKIMPGYLVPIHNDKRKIAINIGIKNTNGFRTYFNNSIEEFWNNPDYYEMEVGDVYVLDTSAYHSVVATKNHTKNRYILSYNMINK